MAKVLKSRKPIAFSYPFNPMFPTATTSSSVFPGFLQPESSQDVLSALSDYWSIWLEKCPSSVPKLVYSFAANFQQILGFLVFMIINKPRWYKSLAQMIS